MATMKELWNNYKAKMEDSIDTIFKKSFHIRQLGEMNEDDVVMTNEVIRIYRESMKLADKASKMYDENVAEMRKEVEDLKEQNKKIISMLEEIKRNTKKELPAEVKFR